MSDHGVLRLMGIGYAELYDKHGAELLRFATVLVGPSDAEDVFSEAVVGAFERVDWSSVENERAYLFKVVLRVALSHRRSVQRRLAREARWAATDLANATNPVDSDVLTALRRLTVRQRAVIYLAYWDDLPAAEIASELSWSVRTVERELTAARKRLEVLLS